MEKLKQNLIFPFLFLSLLLHCVFLLKNYELEQFQIAKNHSFKIKNIRTVGKKTGISKKLLFVPQKPKQAIKKTQPNLKNLAFKDLPFPSKQSSKKIIKSLNLNNKEVKEFLKSTPPGFLSPAQALSAISETDVNIKLEVPKGIKEDELNKHELVFYSFQKRTVLAYINSFQKELNNFEKRNPHLRFPLTKDEQKLAGRVIYDRNGDILKIETLQWSQIKKLQGFFMKVLQNMSSLPNPPQEILENEQFAINFVLTINN